MAKPLGPRVTVTVGKNKTNDDIHSFMLKSTAKFFGFKETAKTSRKGKGGRTVSFRGSRGGANSIKVPTGKTKTVQYKGKSIKIKLYKQVPMPGGMSIPEIVTFLKKAVNNKPDHFVTSDGRTHAVQ